MLFRYYYGCGNYSCVHICGENPNFLIKLLYNCGNEKDLPKTLSYYEGKEETILFDTESNKLYGVMKENGEIEKLEYKLISFNPENKNKGCPPDKEKIEDNTLNLKCSYQIIYSTCNQNSECGQVIGNINID